MVSQGVHGYLLPDNINPDGYKCIVLKIPDDPGYIRAVWGQLNELTRWFAWDRDELKRGKDAAAVMWQVLTWAEKCAEAGMAEDCQFCCDETNQLLQEIIDILSGDGGIGGHITNIAGDIINNTTTTIYNTYLDDPTSVHEDTPDDTYTHDTGDIPADLTTREIVLCYAIEGYIQTIIDAHEAAFEFGEALVTATAAGLLASGMIIPAIIVYVGGQLFDQYTAEVFNDADARKALRCCMYSALHDADTSDQAAFAASLAACGFVPPSHESTMAGWIHASNQNPVNHALFLAHLGANWLLGQAGALSGTDDCICQQPERTCWDFADATTQGWESGKGIVPVDHTDQPYSMSLHTDLPAGGVNTIGPGSWGSGSDLNIYVTLPEIEIGSISWEIYHDGLQIGIPFWLELWDENWNSLGFRTGTLAPGAGWASRTENVLPTIGNARYLSLQIDYAYRHALGCMVINGAVAACPGV